jgi:hypothetical protein
MILRVWISFFSGRIAAGKANPVSGLRSVACSFGIVDLKEKLVMLRPCDLNPFSELQEGSRYTLVAEPFLVQPTLSNARFDKSERSSKTDRMKDIERSSPFAFTYLQLLLNSTNQKLRLKGIQRSLCVTLFVSNAESVFLSLARVNSYLYGILLDTQEDLDVRCA